MHGFHQLFCAFLKKFVFFLVLQFFYINVDANSINIIEEINKKQCMIYSPSKENKLAKSEGKQKPFKNYFFSIQVRGVDQNLIWVIFTILTSLSLHLHLLDIPTLLFLNPKITLTCI